MFDILIVVLQFASAALLGLGAYLTLAASWRKPARHEPPRRIHRL